MSRKPNTPERREQVIQALLRVMARSGYDGASVQAIAREAGLAPGLIHYHFASKQEILLALIAWLVEQGSQRLGTPGAGATDARGRFADYVHARLGLGEGANRDAVAAWVVIGTEAVRQPEVRAVYQRVIAAQLALLEGLLADLCREAGKQAKDLKAIAGLVTAAMEGSYQLAAAAGEVMPKDYAAKAVMALVEGWIVALPGLGNPAAAN